MESYEMQLNHGYYVVTANDLIKGRQKMTLREAQLLAIAIAQVVKEDSDLKTYTVTVPELAAFMGIDTNSLYRDLEHICTSLMQRVVKIQIGGENAKGRKKWAIYHWISCAKYDSGTLTLRLSDEIKPYLLDLEAYYTQTMLGTLMTFRSYYATRLYQYLKADAGAKNKEEWYFTLDEIRELFQVGEKQYERPYNLLQKTIKPALDELNKSDYMHIWDFTEHRAGTKGKPLKGISFKAIFFKDAADKEFYMKKAKPIIDSL